MDQSKSKGIALVSGVVCAICVVLFMQSVQGGAEAQRAEVLAKYGGSQVDVLVAKRDISAGERVEPSMIESRSWVSDLLPDGALRSSENVAGLVASSSICRGEVLLQKRFAESKGQLSVPQGTTAVSVPAKAVQAVGGGLSAGMYVDIYATGGSKTSIIAKDVQVLAVSENGSGVSSSSSWVTVAVEDKLVQQLVAAANTSELYFSLPGDPSPESEEAGSK